MSTAAIETKTGAKRNVSGGDIFSLLHRVFGDAEMAEVFAPHSTIDAYLRVEVALAGAQYEVGLFDADVLAAIVAACENVTIDLEVLWADTRHVGYPILPLLRQIIAAGGPEVGQWLHYGATTQDIMDTGAALQMVAALERLRAYLVGVGDRLAALTEAHASTPMAGRTHALHAVPTTFGAKLAVYIHQVLRLIEDSHLTTERVGCLELSGAAGTSAGLVDSIDAIRRSMAAELSLNVSPGPRHVARDHVAHFVHHCAAITATCARFAREVIDLGRTEIGEVSIRGPRGHGASSTMPQKSNPVQCEAIVGMAGTVAALSSAAYRAMEAGHERSAGEWQIEWHLIPQVATLAGGCLLLVSEVLDRLAVSDARMAANLDLDHGLLFAESTMFALSPLLGRARAHEVVSDAAISVRGGGGQLRDLLADLAPPDLLIPASATVDAALGTAVSDARRAVDVWANSPRTGLPLDNERGAR